MERERGRKGEKVCVSERETERRTHSLGETGRHAQQRGKNKDDVEISKVRNGMMRK